MSLLNASRLESARQRSVEALLEERCRAGHWVGELSTSALSTATASFALGTFDRARGEDGHRALVRGGLRWLAENANSDGGWGDTVRSHSNLPTTTLAWATLKALGDGEPELWPAIEAARQWMERAVGGELEPARLAETIAALYGEDRTFSVPILTLVTLAGQLGDERTSWRLFPALPFELAALPHATFRFVGLPVVSYALPALIAMGLVHHRRSGKPRGPLGLLRRWLTPRTLDVLTGTQPENGGFLEAIPLTSFVTMSLVGAGEADHPVVRRGVSFLVESVREDGSWPIDTNLATWLTTLSVNALGESLPDSAREAILDWILGQQYHEVHPFTRARPGAWAWTDLPGGVPDADDTAGALLALSRLGTPGNDRVRRAVERGLGWLLDLQNRDGGLPTFCRGWGKLPFDRSGADLTAHALRAFEAFSRPAWSGLELNRERLEDASRRALDYLIEKQAADGSWLPLWFGNQDCAGFRNRVFGTSRVLLALRSRIEGAGDALEASCVRGIEFLESAVGEDGGWGGGDPGVPSSVEETALAVETLAAWRRGPLPVSGEILEGGVSWLVEAVESDRFLQPAPVGFYFANLWYHERLYPLIFTTAALGRLEDDPASVQSQPCQAPR